jgi:molybdopterin synthase catalytic subunit
MNDNWIIITAATLNVRTALNFVTDPRAGGIDIFLGTTRAETSSDGKELVALQYEAYEEMAMMQLQELARRGRERFPIVKLAIIHRTGVVPVGDPSVLIAVSCPHRTESFDACRFLIDELKALVTIWKQELWADGSTSWVDPGTKS